MILRVFVNKLLRKAILLTSRFLLFLTKIIFLAKSTVPHFESFIVKYLLNLLEPEYQLLHLGIKIRVFFLIIPSGLLIF